MIETNRSITKDDTVENNSEEKLLSIIKIILPNNESFDLQVDSLELVQEIHFYINRVLFLLSAFCSKMAYEEHLPGYSRDWNDKMQNTRELPREKLIDRVNREKSIFKINSDFVTAATVHYSGGVEDLPTKIVGLKVVTRDELNFSMANYWRRSEIVIDTNGSNSKFELIEDKSLDDVKKIVDETSESGYDEELIKQIIVRSAETVGSTTDSKVVIKFNPDAFQLGVTVPEVPSGF